MLEGIDDVKKILNSYSTAHPGQPIEEIRNFVGTCENDQQLYDRKNFNGHITTSALVIDSDNRMLFIIHAVFNRLLPLGGHVESGDHSLMEAAMRETKEETGIVANDLVYIPAN